MPCWSLSCDLKQLLTCHFSFRHAPTARTIGRYERRTRGSRQIMAKEWNNRQHDACLIFYNGTSRLWRVPDSTQHRQKSAPSTSCEQRAISTICFCVSKVRVAREEIKAIQLSLKNLNNVLAKWQMPTSACQWLTSLFHITYTQGRIVRCPRSDKKTLLRRTKGHSNLVTCCWLVN